MPYPFSQIKKSEQSADVKNVTVRAFTNKTQEKNLEKKLWSAVTDQLIRDRRISYASDEAESDGVIVGTIKRFEETELKHHEDANLSEFRLSIAMDLKFYDRAKKQFVWEEPMLERRFTYVGESKPGGQASEQARNELCDRFALDIVRQVMERLGKEKRPEARPVERNDLPANPPPEYPSTAPF